MADDAAVLDLAPFWIEAAGRRARAGEIAALRGLALERAEGARR